ncbi:ethanolamine kinase 1 isoform 2-T2 [Alca torda]
MSNYIHVPPGSPEVPKLDITVSEREGPGCRQGALQLLRRLRPHWRPEEVTLQLFTDGITNKLIGCYVGDITDDVVLVRIYGNKTELLVDRDEEVKSFRVLQAHGCAPQLYCTFNNGLCYEFMQGEALDPEHVCNPDIFRLIARQLAKIHTIHAHNGWIPKSNLWLKMGKYFSLIPTEFTDEEVNKRFLSDIPSPQVLQEEMAWMKERLSNLGSPVVLCHNDLLCKNIIYNKKRGVCGCSVLLKTESSREPQFSVANKIFLGGACYSAGHFHVGLSDPKRFNLITLVSSPLFLWK